MTDDANRTEHKRDLGLTVGRTADLVGVSVRTLHHWDAIGLVHPSDRTYAGYRVYSDTDVARIHQVLVYRELGFSLAHIAQILAAPHTDATDHLQRQRDALTDQIARLQAMVEAVDHMLAASKTGIQLTPQQQVEIFGDDWRPEWVNDAQQRWGDTAQWAQYSQRAATLSHSDWEQISADTHTLEAELASAKRNGVTPGCAQANALAERHRSLMSTYFDCTHAMQVCMGRMFVHDEGFAAHYNRREPGLAHWFQEVLFANAEAHGVDPQTAQWE